MADMNDLHAIYASLDDVKLQRLCTEALAAGNKDEAHFWRGVLNVYLQSRQRELIESGEYYG